ncbi:N-acetylglucosamine-6-phosphate deacetylase [Aspergillus clavatus NRRL 1]|uniref:N-acetylglucosamine-6-phosphate deacetylase n=1 Tax=Aspergillus clavatus (strain ATCC 1007 / CBS 513.65 / DSM 816 / NCTC 3887 / NRRL 1 / QM 1276 / 107) TaxID=344612 RepID=A1C3U7_ASPCL|nr:n-acetylglucosamine-6-phosphate deacetylase [Aspergillus clavatus NRRL 1]EAW15087.1 n-acetylglucosamine-6-phosphate deacetylase [Aspergillus clavatus NRRL 1]
MPGKTTPTPRITKFTNCRVVKGKDLVEKDVWIDSLSGKILKDQEAFYGLHLSPDEIIDLGGRILAPGLIDVQLNGAQGFDFSVPQASKEKYDEGLRMVNKGLARTGVTSYLPTVVSSTPEVYWKVLPSLGPSGSHHRGEDGAESLGAHVEGPFISPGRNGIHKTEVLRAAESYEDVAECYGRENLTGSSKAIKMITAAPEVGNMISNIPSLTAEGIIYSIGHSDATYEQALAATSEGATMITHLFNAMRPFYHRNPGIFGLLGQSERRRPYYGVIADGIHLHPTSIRIAYNAHPEGLILVTDAMKLCGLPDGVYDWTNGERIVKTGARLTLEGSDKIAGSSATLIECVNNFRRWSGASTAEALNAVTATPARLLGLQGVKGTLDGGADADLVVLSDEERPFSEPTLTVCQVWKRGVKIHDTGSTDKELAL